MNHITRKHLSRRTLLRGAGVALALPWLDAMTPALKAAKSMPGGPAIRLAFVYVPNGIIPGAWTPLKGGSDFEITRTLKALEPFREQMLVLSGLAQVNGRALGDGAGDHARAGATWLTGVHPKKTEAAGIHAGISADQLAAKEFGKSTQFASLELGLESPSLAGGCDSGYSCAYSNTISWRTPTTPNPVEINPRAVFERLFGEGDSTDPKARMKQLKDQGSLLDYITGDIDRMETNLGAGDRNKLSEYLDSIRDVERRIQKAEEQNGTTKVPLMQRPTGVPDEFETHARLMMDLQTIAFQADLTRVTTFMMGREGSDRSYREIGISDGHHPLTHHQNDPVKIEKVTQIDTYHVKVFSYFLDKLRNTPDGDGTLLDHSMVLYGSSICDGNAHTHHNLPLVLVGGAGGQIKGGRHVTYPKETPMNNLLMTMLDKAKVPLPDKFGDGTSELKLIEV
ncbi:MAG TPA: DUF1552 domain-containing protein [Bryobacteraceae bacterium]|jgi:hypothetical protein|nr:DUF1552 domain-containing protein [Bryobacteraceae bacterium]